jgi:hypothetical protein
MKTSFHRIFFILLLGGTSLFLLAFTPFADSHGRRAYARVAGNFLKAKSTAPDVYLVEITVLNISSIDLNAGTYAVDMFISFICKNAPCKNEPSTPWHR